MIHRIFLLTQYRHERRYARSLMRAGQVALAYVARDIAEEIMLALRGDA